MSGLAGGMPQLVAAPMQGRHILPCACNPLSLDVSMPPSPRLKEFGVEPLEERIVETLLPQEAKALFLERFGELAG